MVIVAPFFDSRCSR